MDSAMIHDSAICAFVLCSVKVRGQDPQLRQI